MIDPRLLRSTESAKLPGQDRREPDEGVRAVRLGENGGATRARAAVPFDLVT
jgi:hypothetical protein